NAISSAMLATGAVGSTQLASASVTNAKLGTDAVLTTNLGSLAVTTDKIANGNVTTAKIADSNVTTAKIADSNVTTVKIAPNAVDNTKLRDSTGLSVIGRTDSTTGDPADIVAGTDGQVLRRSGTSVGFGTVGTDGIADNAVTTAKILNNSVSLDDLVATVQQALCPPGTIVAYGGQTAPAGWLLCNGASYNRTSYPALFTAISISFGSSSSTTFNVPDFRGRFLRGRDGGAGRDPDRATRTAMAAGGATGDQVGSVQADEFKSHTHALTSQIWYMSEGNDASGGYYDPVLENRASGATGGSETRPINANVNYIIKY
ncbi:MAG: phage tail protein, partial [Luteolibacter sp.]